MIELKQLSKHYHINHRRITALNNINLRVEAGEIFGIFGESGAGKSTLLRTINLLETPSDGQVLINNIDLRQLSRDQLNIQRKRIGMIFQHFNLLSSRTAFANIALPLEFLHYSKQAIATEVNALLHLIHLEEHADHYPAQLSGGQKQRVSIARALTTKPDILLCDEITSALDVKATHTILNLLKEINHQLGVTIVLITHEMEVIKQICDRAAVLHHGKLIEVDSIINLFAKPQSQITKQLVQKSLHIELPQAIKKNLQAQPAAHKSPVVRFTFVGDESGQPLMTTLIQKFNITINIIQANIETIQNVTIGFTVCQLSGDEQAIQQALAYLKPLSVTAEVLGYV